MTRRDKWALRPTVVRYRNYCDQIRASFNRTTKFNSATFLRIVAIFKARDTKLWAEPHTKRPDIDNIIKGVMDALVLKDENIYCVEAVKIWGVKDELYIGIEINGQD